MARGKAATETPDFIEVGGVRWPALTAAEMAGLCGFGQEMLRKLERAGVFSKLGRDRYSPPEVFAGVLAYLRDEERRSTKSAEARRVLEARAREIEIRTAERTGELVDMPTLVEFFARAMGEFRAELAGVPIAATRDLAMREGIHNALEAAIDRLRNAFLDESKQWGNTACKMADERFYKRRDAAAKKARPQ